MFMWYNTSIKMGKDLCSRSRCVTGRLRSPQTLQCDCSPRTPSGERSGGLGHDGAARLENKARCVQSIFGFGSRPD